jgi:uncharacterized protein YbjT (DUF2867 family)
MILVTGAGGTVGSELLKQLREQDAEVRAAFHSPEKAARAKSHGIDSVVLDFADRASIRAALKGIDKLFLLGPTLPNQIELETNVVEEAKNAGVTHIVKLSVFDAGGEKYTFAKWHRAVEKIIERSGLTYTFLRPNGFMQNTLTYYLPTIKSDGAFYLPTKDSKEAAIDVRDIAAVAVQALTASGHENKVYELSGPEALTHEQIAQKLSAAAGRQIKYLDVPAAAFKQGAVGAGVPEAYADALLNLYQFYLTGGAAKVTNDVERVTGKKPRSFDEFARDHADAFKAAA